MGFLFGEHLLKLSSHSAPVMRSMLENKDEIAPRDSLQPLARPCKAQEVQGHFEKGNL